jgi:hypothetical protein
MLIAIVERYTLVETERAANCEIGAANNTPARPVRSLGHHAVKVITRDALCFAA